MRPLSTSQAAKLVGKHKSTILRSIRSGKISASRDENGTYLIDPAELTRVYEASESVRDEAVMHHAPPECTTQEPQSAPIEPPEWVMDRIKYLETQLDEARQERERLIGVIETQTRQIEHKPSEVPDQDQKGYDNGMALLAKIVIGFLLAQGVIVGIMKWL